MMEININKYLSELEGLINTDSGTMNIEGNEKIIDFFKIKFDNLGFDVDVLHVGPCNRPVLWARTAGKKSFDYYLGGHVDTVFPDGTVMERPFRIENGQAFGPGTVDMKAGALLILYIAEYMSENCPNAALSVVLNSDEEIGSVDSGQTLQEIAGKCKSIFIFEGQRKQGQFVNERKGIIKYKVEVNGLASHAGTAPKEGASAIVELANFIINLDKLKKLDKGTSINIGTMQGGTALNVVAPYSTAMVEVRYTDAKELIRVQRGIDKITGKSYVERTSIKVTEISHYPPLVLTEQTLDLMEKLKVYGLQYVKAGGTSDANRLAGLAIPIIDGCGPGGGFPHNEREFLDIKTVNERYKLMCRILSQIYN